MNEQQEPLLAWQGETAGSEDEDAAIAAYNEHRETLRLAVERERRRSLRLAQGFMWLSGTIGISALLLLAGPLLYGVGWLLWKWLG